MPASVRPVSAASRGFTRDLRGDTDTTELLGKLLAAVDEVILGKSQAVRQCMACLLAGGHLLLEDLPGVGKTTLAQTLARVLGLEFKRVQFTSDLLPADIIGVSIYRPTDGSFQFQPGPVFSEVLLADEVNRAPPKSQSALLEAMEEHQVSSDGVTRPLPEPFFVIATQNPHDALGVFPLPESQLDRFLMRVSLGYPAASEERALLAGESRRELLQRLKPITDQAGLAGLQQAVREVHASDAVVAYVQSLLQHSRRSGRYRHGLSPRAGLALLQAARAWALLDGRDAVLPEDIQAQLPAVAAHRLRLGGDVGDDADEAAIVAPLIEDVAIP